MFMYRSSLPLKLLLKIPLEMPFFLFSDLDVGLFNFTGLKNSQGRSTEGETETEDSGEDNAPLFYCPGRRGFYSPRQGKATFERLNAFRNTGR